MTHKNIIERLLLDVVGYLDIIAQATVDANIYREGQGATYNPGDELLADIQRIQEDVKIVQADIDKASGPDKEKI